MIVHRRSPTRRPPTARGRRLRGQRGSALLLGWAGVAVTGLALVIVVDLAAYLVAATRAQGAADAAALAAAAAADPHGAGGYDPTVTARYVAHAWGATLRRCDCRRGTPQVEVTVELPVRAVVVTRFAGRRVAATADATVVPP